LGSRHGKGHVIERDWGDEKGPMSSYANQPLIRGGLRKRLALKNKGDTHRTTADPNGKIVKKRQN